jgi:GT2 family glycosyltransferase
MAPLKVSFIVPLFNHIEHSKAMLASLQASLPPGLTHEIILVDDASTDGTLDWLRTLDLPQVQVVLNPTNLGFARANHAGEALATGNVLALLNNDLILNPGWLEPMLAVVQNPQLGAGAVGNVQTRVADCALDHSGVHVTPSGQLDHVRVLPTSDVEHSRVFAVTGACCLIRRDVFESVGGFDEAFVNGGEDIDLCLKVKAKGLHVYMAYQSVVQHHVSLSRDRTSLQNEVNSRLLYQKWRPQLKLELAQVWQKGLRSDDAALLSDALDGLQPSFLATPFAAAQVMSENALLREEARWTRLLDQTDPNPSLAHQTRVTGWARSADDTCYLLCSPVLRVLIDNPIGLDGFYVSGKQVNPPQGAQTTITITVNGLQAKSFTLGPELHFNVGISHPVVLPAMTNCIEVTFRGQYPAGTVGDMEPLDPCSYITLAHLVIDKKLVTHLAGA